MHYDSKQGDIETELMNSPRIGEIATYVVWVEPEKGGLCGPKHGDIEILNHTLSHKLRSERSKRASK